MGISPRLRFSPSFWYRSVLYYQSRIKCPLFGGKNLKWSNDNKHHTRPHTTLKNKKAKNGGRSSAFVFFSIVWGRVGWSIYHHSIWVFRRKGDILFCSGNIMWMQYCITPYHVSAVLYHVYCITPYNVLKFHPIWYKMSSNHILYAYLGSFWLTPVFSLSFNFWFLV